DDRAELVHDRRHRVRPREQAEDPGRDQQRRGNRQEGVVGERGGEVRDVVAVRLLQRALEDRDVVPLREVGGPWIAEPGLAVLGLRLWRVLERRLVKRRPAFVAAVVLEEFHPRRLSLTSASYACEVPARRR